MVEGTHKYKRLKGMLKETDQKCEKDLERVESKLDTALKEIKALINGVTLHTIRLGVS